MRKFYPYLQDAYLSNSTQELQNKNFLSSVDSFISKKLYTKITLLDWQENPLKSIEGEIVSGNQTKDGASAVRHTCTLSCTLNRGDFSIEDIKNDYSINKKIFIEIGIRNDTKQYSEYPILWFPQGVYFINAIGLSSSTTGGVNLNLTLKDKMCMLNGDLGGCFGSTVVLDVMDTQLPSGEYIEEKVLVYNIIQELVHHYGGEDLNNIVISDVPLRIKRVMKWTGQNPLYMNNAQNETFSQDYTVIQPSDLTNVAIFNNGDDVGYIYDDFFYTDELVAGPAETITSILDKLKQYLGNFEYFYDVYGIFRFREIKNYVNSTRASFLLNEMSENQYLVEVNNDKTSFLFSDSDNITSITVTPQYNNIKNDYIVQGLKKATDTDLSYPIMYHLVIDDKPAIIEESWELIQQLGEISQTTELKYHYGTYSNIVIYEEPDTKLQKAACYVSSIKLELSENEGESGQWVDDLPNVGDFNLIYKTTNNTYQYWDGKVYKTVKVLAEYIDTPYYCRDWRTKLYMDGVIATPLGLDPGYYYPELCAYWPQMYDLINQRFWDEENVTTANAYRSLTQGIYYLDFIDPSTSSLGEYSVKNIGRRTHVTVNDEINCLFQPEIPNIVLLDVTADNLQELKNECIANAQPWSVVRGNIYGALATGGYHNSAFDQIKYDLYLYTRYQKNVSLTALPIYWLEPNTRVRINESSTNTYGDFMISNLSYAFGPHATMAVSCTEVAERF